MHELCLDLKSCQIVSSINNKDFVDAIKKNVHLHQYLHELEEKRIKIPKYVVQLSRELGKQAIYNFLYPVGDPNFVHIYSRGHGLRPIYNVVEPRIPKRLSKILPVVEKGIAYYITPEDDYETSSEQKEILVRLLRKLVVLNESLKGVGVYKVVSRLPPKILTNKDTFETLKYILVKEKVGTGILEPFIKDPYIEDISCDGVGPIFIEHKVFGSCESTISFKNDEELDEFVITLSERIGRPVNYRKPLVDGTLPDGSRINIVFGRDISRRGTNFTIRKFSDIPLSVTQLCAWNTLSLLEAAYLWMLLEAGMSVWVAGETASGKTTTLKAITTFIRPEVKIVSVEDTPEVVVPHENWVREVTRESEEGGSAVELFDLLKAALRQRPNYIIVGEIRGKEGSVAFQAMQTGHPVLATFHASTVEKLIQRLTGVPIEIPKTYIDNLSAVVIQSGVRVPQTGRFERRVITLNEIIGYDSIEDRFNFIELFNWEPSLDEHVFKGEGTSFLLEQKIAVMRGYSRREIRKIYRDLEKRAKILDILIKRNVFDYYDVWRAIKNIYELGVDRALLMLERGAELWKQGELSAQAITS
jgi:flagellar protein FlaI